MFAVWRFPRPTLEGYVNEELPAVKWGLHYEAAKSPRRVVLRVRGAPQRLKLGHLRPQPLTPPKAMCWSIAAKVSPRSGGP